MTLAKRVYVTFDRVETRFFTPDKPYIEESMSSLEVRDFIVRSKFRANVYMIAGIKVAIGTSVTSTKLRQRKVHVQLGVDGTAVGVPLGLGPDVGVSCSRTQGTSSDGASDFVFAFRLREIIYSKRQGIMHREFSKGALFSLDDDHRKPAAERKEENREDFELLGLADEDVTAEDVDLEASAMVDDDGEACKCLIVN